MFFFFSFNFELFEKLNFLIFFLDFFSSFLFVNNFPASDLSGDSAEDSAGDVLYAVMLPKSSNDLLDADAGFVSNFFF